MISIFLWGTDPKVSLAQAGLNIISDKAMIIEEEELEVKVEIHDTEIASLLLEIYWDDTKLEYKKGPENSNYSNHRVLYTWINRQGQNQSTIEISGFVFKGIEDGMTNIVVKGEFYHANGEKVEMDQKKLEIQIGEKANTMEENQSQVQSNVLDNNSDLRVLRLNHEGISPTFDKRIKEYYFIAKETIKDLEVTAIPENEEANVTITGNYHLEMGQNTITIQVESKDKTTSSIYQIHVTRTDNIQTANANLENLAIREVLALNPEFDPNITHYEIEVANDVNSIDVLAIPQREMAKVEISGNQEINVGDNQVKVIVLAENGMTNKKYEIQVHRRTQEEEIQKQEEEKIQLEKLSVLLSQEEDQQEDKNEMTEKQEKNDVVLMCLLLSIGGIIWGVVFYVRKKMSQ